MTAANLIEQDLEAIGLNIIKKQQIWQRILAKVNSGDYHLAMIGLAFNVIPHQSSYWSVESLNYANINDEHLESLIAEGRALTSF